MPEVYSKPFQISNVMRHSESPGRVRTVYPGIFRHIKGHSAIFSHVQANIQTFSEILREIMAY